MQLQVLLFREAFLHVQRKLRETKREVDCADRLRIARRVKHRVVQRMRVERGSRRHPSEHRGARRARVERRARAEGNELPDVRLYFSRGGSGAELDIKVPCRFCNALRPHLASGASRCETGHSSRAPRHLGREGSAVLEQHAEQPCEVAQGACVLLVKAFLSAPVEHLEDSQRLGGLWSRLIVTVEHAWEDGNAYPRLGSTAIDASRLET
eukprot:scaffold48_cov311-Pinguiococcus_pyrenoidosus.AAC.234